MIEFLKIKFMELSLVVTFWACIIVAQMAETKEVETTFHIIAVASLAAELYCWWESRKYSDYIPEEEG